ncbi:hypothetical protein [Bradyrhizobium sp.]|uniref:hypothetical protein n=1 Tax=Bradyrhizobium sp. TaxID=376 RepID=UPI002637DE5E|nr:hypothetical protein [Bradyrhizobium sp.]
MLGIAARQINCSIAAREAGQGAARPGFAWIRRRDENGNEEFQQHSRMAAKANAAVLPKSPVQID